MKDSILNSEGLLGDFKRDTDLIRGYYLSLPQLKFINVFIYKLHFNHNLNCLQSVLEYDYDFKFHDRPEYYGMPFSKDSLLRPEIKNKTIILNSNETSFINNILFQKEAEKKFLTFRTSLNNYTIKYKGEYKYRIIELLKDLLSNPKQNYEDTKRISSNDLDYNTFKDIINSQLELTKNRISEIISNLEHLSENEVTFFDRLRLKALDSNNLDVVSFINELDESSQNLFALKWENKAFESIELLFVNKSDKLIQNIRFIYFLLEPDSIEIYKNILDALLEEYDYETARRNFNEIGRGTHNDILVSKKSCISVKNLIESNLD